MTVAAKRKPVRAINPALLRKAWSEGHTYYPPTRKPLYGPEKPLEEQTLDDLCGGDFVKVMNDLNDGRTPNYGEPLSESRRSWIERGAGVLSLNVRRLFGPDEEVVELIDIVQDDPERDSAIYGRGGAAPYTTVDPNMQRAIQWEIAAAQNGDCVTMYLVEDESGRLSIKVKGWGFKTKDEFMKAAKAFMASIGGKPTSLAELRERVARANEALDYDTVRFSSANANEENWRLSAPAHDEWHTAFDAYGKADDALPGDPLEFKGTHFRRAKNFDPGYDLWHAQGRDQVERELGTHLMSDSMLEELLGWDQWDEEGNACVSP